MTVKIGSARHDENGKYTNGAAGDQLQTSGTNDTSGEVSMQDFYVHSKGWYVIRAKSAAHANAIAAKMKAACNNVNIGYDQNGRLGIITYGIGTTTKTECDCSSLVRECIKEATGKDPGNFTTASEVSMLAATGLFEDKISYVSQAATPVYDGDILVTKTKGHTVVVVEGASNSGGTEATSTGGKAESAQKYDKDIAGTYKTTAALYLRTGAGAVKNSLVVMPKSTSVKNYGYYSLDGSTKWLYVTATVDGKKYTGFCSSKYLSKA